MSLLQDLQQHYDLTMLLIEHNMKFVMHICQRLTVLDHGLTIAQGRAGHGPVPSPGHPGLSGGAPGCLRLST